MFQSALSTVVRATGQYGHPAHPSRLVAPTALAGGASSSSRPPLDVIELSDSEDELQASTALRSERERDVCTTLRGVEVPPGWSVIGGSLLVWSHLSPAPSAQIAAFDFDDTLAKTALGGFDPNAWTNLFPHVPAMLPVEPPPFPARPAVATLLERILIEFLQYIDQAVHTPLAGYSATRQTPVSERAMLWSGEGLTARPCTAVCSSQQLLYARG